MITLAKTNSSLRVLSQFFTPASFRRILRDGEFSSIKKNLKKHLEVYDSANVLNFLEFLYGKLEENYRNEYIYKNALLNQKLLAEHSLETTTVLNEFRIGNSISDFVLLNGEIKTFEIKTDLDGFEKLDKQIEDYQKFSNKVYVVVSKKHETKIFEKYQNSPIGIIVFSNDNKLETVKSANNFVKRFDHGIIFKTLRKQEYLEIVQDYFGKIPLIPNTQIFKESLKLISKIDVCEFQEQVRTKLKLRSLRCPTLLESPKTPKELKHICYTLNLSENEYELLFRFLNSNLENILCTSHT
jgi:hypothetical protein